MKKLTITLLLCLCAVAIISFATPAKAKNTSNSSECYLENVKAWVVTNIPGQAPSYEAYFASKATANIFIGFFGGGTISNTPVCKPYDVVIRQTTDPCTPCS